MQSQSISIRTHSEDDFDKDCFSRTHSKNKVFNLEQTSSYSHISLR